MTNCDREWYRRAYPEYERYCPTCGANFNALFEVRNNPRSAGKGRPAKYCKNHRRV